MSPTPMSTPMSTPPLDELEYHEVYVAGRQGWGWYVGGIVTMGVMFLAVGPLIVVLGAIVLFVVTGTDPADLGDKLTALADTDNVTPSVLLFINVTLVMAIPAAWFCTRVFHGLRPAWLASVKPRIRWTWLLASFGVAFVALFVAVALSAFIPSSGGDGDLGGTANAFTDTSRDFLLVIVLLTPLQAVAEEYAFRGYLTQAFGGLFRTRAAAVVAPALLFAAAHGTQSAPIFVDRFAFGIAAGILVIATGGLEAGIAYHVLNNVLAFGLALFYGDMTDTLNPTGGSWWDIVVTLVKSAVFLALSIWTARRMGVATRARPGVLEPSRSRV